MNAFNIENLKYTMFFDISALHYSILYIETLKQTVNVETVLHLEIKLNKKKRTLILSVVIFIVI